MANEDKFNVKKIIKNGAKVVICGTDTIQAEKWINVTQTAFRALQVPNKHQIGIMPASGGSVPGVEDHGGDQISAPGRKLHYLGGVCGSL